LELEMVRKRKKNGERGDCIGKGKRVGIESEK